MAQSGDGPNTSGTHSDESEMALLGSTILDPSCISEVSKIIEPTDFYLKAHKLIYQSVLQLWRDEKPVDLVLVKDVLLAANQLQEVGGIDYLASLVETVPTAANAVHYAHNVKKFSLRRQIVSLAHSVGRKVEKGEPLNGDHAALVKLSEIIEHPEIKSKPRSIEEVRKEILEMGEIKPVPSSFPGLNENISGGYRARQLVILGAFTGGGKTTCLMREAIDKAKLGHPVLYISCELAATELLKKIDLALRVGEDIPDNIPLKFEDRLVDFKDIAFTITNWVQEQTSPLTPIVTVDYIQRIRNESANGREREVAKTAEDLQTIAKLLNIVVLCAAQLNRESQKETEPQLHHMRESGLIEQTADIVLLVSKMADDRMRVHLAKNRWGTSDVPLDITVDYVSCTFQITDATKYWIPLAERIVEYLTENKGSADYNELSMQIGWGGRGKHPKKKDIINASTHTKAFKVTKTGACLNDSIKNRSDASD